MKIVGCDLHARQQTISMVDTGTRELTEKAIRHEGNAVREYLVGYATTRMKKTGPSHAVGHKSSNEEECHSLERKKRLDADAICVSETTKAKTSSPLTRPASLEMFNNDSQTFLTKFFGAKTGAERRPK